MKKIIFFVLVFLILTWPSDVVKHTVDPDLFIFEPDAVAIGALNFMVESDDSTEGDETRPVAICNCNKSTGKISYDGGTSLVDCPCTDGGNPCGCVNCKKGEVPPSGGVDVKVDSDKVDINVDLSEYRILKLTASWCGPCVVWERNNLSKFEAAGLEVKPYDVDQAEGRALMNAVGAPGIPFFLVATKADNLYHKDPTNSRRYLGEYAGGFTLEDAISEIRKLDASIHPSKASGGPYYVRQGDKETPINGSLWASKSVIEGHLRDGNHNAVIDWPLSKLSRYELKAIHDDDHANILGVLYGYQP